MMRAVLFDFDDTLVDTLNSKVPPIIEYCAVVHGVCVKPDEVRALWGTPFWEKMRALAKSDRIDTERYLSISQKYPLEPFPESRAVLTALQSRLPIGIVTSLARPVLLHSLNSLGWDDVRFSTLVTEGDGSAHKPDPRVFEPALMALPGIERHEILYVGDALSDAHAALGAGLQFRGIARDSRREADFRDAGFRYWTNLTPASFIFEKNE
jgi:phosphoglycolate phosphatase-like HAD superfamily hydrolase